VGLSVIGTCLICSTDFLIGLPPYRVIRSCESRWTYTDPIKALVQHPSSKYRKERAAIESARRCSDSGVQPNQFSVFFQSAGEFQIFKQRHGLESAYLLVNVMANKNARVAVQEAKVSDLVIEQVHKRSRKAISVKLESEVAPRDGFI